MANSPNHGLGLSALSFGHCSRSPPDLRHRPSELSGGANLPCKAQRLADTMRRRGIGRGDVILFMLPNWYEAGVVYLASKMMPLIPAGD